MSPREQTVEIRPGVGMLALLSSMNYRPWYALSELVDNALASFMSNKGRLKRKPYRQDHVTVRIRFDRGNDVIEVSDDAAGIAEADVDRAFRPADPPPDTSGLAQFGIGMKSAACWYANQFTVMSTALGEPVRREVRFDVPKIVKRHLDQLPISIEGAASEDHGTTITMSDLHRPIPVGRTLGKVRGYLASIYRDYLRRGLLVLEVGEEPVAYETPEILRAPRWDAGKKGRAKEWRKDISFTLPSGRKISGWAALRAKGSTAEAGLALLFRGKVVVGAGGGAADTDDLFRPAEIFGSPNSFESQRLFGEIDVSDLRVAHSKDAIIWDGEEEQFLASLKRQLDARPTPLITMAHNHRVTEKGPAVDRELTSAVESTVDAASQSDAVDRDVPVADNGRPRKTKDMVSRRFQIKIPGSELDVVFAVIVGTGRSWIRVIDGARQHTIEVDRQHPFMQSFAHLPGQDVEPVLRLAAALGLAEIEARHTGAPGAGTIRTRLNELLRGPLARTPIDEIPGAPDGG